ncbi:hypothetical protein [Streptomyces sp. NPDC001068]|uniref:hypothetical protein n=1 Tax=Streptomyces sp. NPDC001068 TaxID=3364544 RepID=UPI00369EFD3F
MLNRPAAAHAELQDLSDGLEVKAARRWNPALHPRDSKGRFIETGGIVRLWGGDLARVMRALPNDRILVQDQTGPNEFNGRRHTTSAKWVSMVARPDGSAPTDNEHKVEAEDEKRDKDARRGNGVVHDDAGDPDTPNDAHPVDDRGRPIGEDDHPVGPRENDDQDEPEHGRHPVNVRALPNEPTSGGSRFQDTAAVRQHFLDLADRPDTRPEMAQFLRSVATDDDLRIAGDLAVLRDDSTGRWYLTATGTGQRMDLAGDFATPDEASEFARHLRTTAPTKGAAIRAFARGFDFSNPDLDAEARTWRSDRDENIATAIKRARGEFDASRPNPDTAHAPHPDAGTPETVSRDQLQPGDRVRVTVGRGDIEWPDSTRGQDKPETVTVEGTVAPTYRPGPGTQGAPLVDVTLTRPDGVVMASNDSAHVRRMPSQADRLGHTDGHAPEERRADHVRVGDVISRGNFGHVVTRINRHQGGRTFTTRNLGGRGEVDQFGTRPDAMLSVVPRGSRRPEDVLRDVPSHTQQHPNSTDARGAARMIVRDWGRVNELAGQQWPDGAPDEFRTLAQHMQNVTEDPKGPEGYQQNADAMRGALDVLHGLDSDNVSQDMARSLHRLEEGLDYNADRFEADARAIQARRAAAAANAPDANAPETNAPASPEPAGEPLQHDWSPDNLVTLTMPEALADFLNVDETAAMEDPDTRKALTEAVRGRNGTLKVTAPIETHRALLEWAWTLAGGEGLDSDPKEVRAHRNYTKRVDEAAAKLEEARAAKPDGDAPDANVPTPDAGGSTPDAPSANAPDAGQGTPDAGTPDTVTMSPDEVNAPAAAAHGAKAPSSMDDGEIRDEIVSLMEREMANGGELSGVDRTRLQVLEAEEARRAGRAPKREDKPKPKPAEEPGGLFDVAPDEQQRFVADPNNPDDLADDPLGTPDMFADHEGRDTSRLRPPQSRKPADFKPGDRFVDTDGRTHTVRDEPIRTPRGRIRVVDEDGGEHFLAPDKELRVLHEDETAPEVPETNTPEANAPEGDAPSSDAPDTNTPGADAADTPDANAPEGDTPGTPDDSVAPPAPIGEASPASMSDEDIDAELEALQAWQNRHVSSSGEGPRVQGSRMLALSPVGSRRGDLWQEQRNRETARKDKERKEKEKQDRAAALARAEIGNRSADGSYPVAVDGDDAGSVSQTARKWQYTDAEGRRSPDFYPSRAQAVAALVQSRDVRRNNDAEHARQDQARTQTPNGWTLGDRADVAENDIIRIPRMGRDRDGRPYPEGWGQPVRVTGVEHQDDGTTIVRFSNPDGSHAWGSPLFLRGPDDTFAWANDRTRPEPTPAWRHELRPRMADIGDDVATLLNHADGIDDQDQERMRRLGELIRRVEDGDTEDLQADLRKIRDEAAWLEEQFSREDLPFETRRYKSWAVAAHGKAQRALDHPDFQHGSTTDAPTAPDANAPEGGVPGTPSTGPELPDEFAAVRQRYGGDMVPASEIQRGDWVHTVSRDPVYNEPMHMVGRVVDVTPVLSNGQVRIEVEAHVKLNGKDTVRTEFAMIPATDLAERLPEGNPGREDSSDLARRIEGDFERHHASKVPVPEGWQAVDGSQIQPRPGDRYRIVARRGGGSGPHAGKEHMNVTVERPAEREGYWRVKGQPLSFRPSDIVAIPDDAGAQHRDDAPDANLPNADAPNADAPNVDDRATRARDLFGEGMNAVGGDSLPEMQELNDRLGRADSADDRDAELGDIADRMDELADQYGLAGPQGELAADRFRRAARAARGEQDDRDNHGGDDHSNAHADGDRSTDGASNDGQNDGSSNDTTDGGTPDGEDRGQQRDDQTAPAGDSADEPNQDDNQGEPNPDDTQTPGDDQGQPDNEDEQRQDDQDNGRQRNDTNPDGAAPDGAPDGGGAGAPDSSDDSNNSNDDNGDGPDHANDEEDAPNPDEENQDDEERRRKRRRRRNNRGGGTGGPGGGGPGGPGLPHLSLPDLNVPAGTGGGGDGGDGSHGDGHHPRTPHSPRPHDVDSLRNAWRSGEGLTAGEDTPERRAHLAALADREGLALSPQGGIALYPEQQDDGTTVWRFAQARNGSNLPGITLTTDDPEEARALAGRFEEITDANGDPFDWHQPQGPASVAAWRDGEGRTLPQAIRAVQDDYQQERAGAFNLPEDLTGMDDADLEAAMRQGLGPEDELRVMAEMDRRDGYVDERVRAAAQATPPANADEAEREGRAMDEALRFGDTDVTQPAPATPGRLRREFDALDEERFQAAMQATGGRMLSPEAEAQGIDPRALFSGGKYSNKQAKALASPELKHWFDGDDTTPGNGRLTYPQYRAREADRALRAEFADWDEARYRQAVDFTNGYFFRREYKFGGTDFNERELFSGGSLSARDRWRQYASDELQEWYDLNGGRQTFAQFREARRANDRAERHQHEEEELQRAAGGTPEGGAPDGVAPLTDDDVTPAPPFNAATPESEADAAFRFGGRDRMQEFADRAEVRPDGATSEGVWLDGRQIGTIRSVNGGNGDGEPVWDASPFYGLDHSANSRSQSRDTAIANLVARALQNGPADSSNPNEDMWDSVTLHLAGLTHPLPELPESLRNDPEARARYDRLSSMVDSFRDQQSPTGDLRQDLTQARDDFAWLHDALEGRARTQQQREELSDLKTRTFWADRLQQGLGEPDSGPERPHAPGEPQGDGDAPAPAAPTPEPVNAPDDTVDPSATPEPTPEPDPDPISGQPAHWARVGDLQQGDMVRMNGTTRRGRPVQRAGYVQTTPQLVDVTRRGRTDQMWRTWVTENPDGTGAAGNVYTSANATAARAEAPDNVVPGSPVSGAQASLRSGDLPDQIPADRDGNGLFPGSTVRGTDDREGTVTGAAPTTVSVHWSDGNDDDALPATTLTVTNGQRPDGWTADGHRVTTQNIVSDSDGALLGPVDDVDGDNVTVHTADGTITRSAGDLRVTGQVRDDEPATAPVTGIDEPAAADLKDGDVVVLDLDGQLSTVAITSPPHRDGDRVTLQYADTTTGEMGEIDVDARAVLPRAQGPDGGAPDLGPDNAPEPADDLTVHPTPRTVDPVTGPTVDPELDSSDRNVIGDHADGPDTDPDAHQAAVRITSDLPVTPEQAQALATQLRSAADPSTPEGRAALRAADHLDRAAGRTPPAGLDRPRASNAAQIGEGDLVAMPDERHGNEVRVFRVIDAEDGPGGVRSFLLEDENQQWRRRVVHGAMPVWQLPEAEPEPVNPPDVDDTDGAPDPAGDPGFGIPGGPMRRAGDGPAAPAAPTTTAAPDDSSTPDSPSTPDEPTAPVAQVRPGSLRRGDVIDAPVSRTGYQFNGHRRLTIISEPQRNGWWMQLTGVDEDGNVHDFGLHNGRAVNVYDRNRPTPALPPAGTPRDPNQVPQTDLNQLVTDHGRAHAARIIDEAIAGTEPPGDIHALREGIAQRLTPDALANARQATRQDGIAALDAAGITGRDRASAQRRLRTTRNRAHDDTVRAALRTINDLEPLDGESNEDLAARARDLLRLIPDQVAGRPDADPDADPDVTRAVTGHADAAVNALLQQLQAAGVDPGDAERIARILTQQMAGSRQATARRIARRVAAANPDAGQQSGLLARIVAALVRLAKRFGELVKQGARAIAEKYRDTRDRLARLRAFLGRMVRRVRQWPESRRLARLHRAVNLPAADGESLAARISHWAGLMPEPGRFGQAQRRLTFWRPTTWARLASGRLPDRSDRIQWTPDRAADGGPGLTGLRHMAALRMAGQDVDTDVTRRLSAALGDDFGDDPHATLQHADDYVAASERRLVNLQAARSSATIPDDPDLDIEITAARSELAAARREYSDLRDRYAAAVPDAVAASLADIRDMGPEGNSAIVFGPDTDPDAERAVRGVQRLIPRSWLNTPEARRLTAVDGTQGRYEPEGQRVTVADLADEGLGTAGFALGQHFAGHLGDLDAAQRAFQFSRTHTGRPGARRMQRSPWDRLRRRQQTQPETGDTLARSIQAMFSGDWYQDDDMRAFLLGLLATR